MNTAIENSKLKTVKYYSTKAWHFSNGKLRYDDNRKVKAGVVHTVDFPYLHKSSEIAYDKPTLCHAGLHGSVKALDALYYAEGGIVSFCDITHDVVVGDDKICGAKREYIWVVDAEKTLCDFARWCALQVIELWDAPDVVRNYLETGDESLRKEAREASWDATLAMAKKGAWTNTWAATLVMSAAGEGAGSWSAAACAAGSAAGAAAEEVPYGAWTAAAGATAAVDDHGFYKKANKKLEEMLDEVGLQAILNQSA